MDAASYVRTYKYKNSKILSEMQSFSRCTLLHKRKPRLEGQGFRRMVLRNNYLLSQ